MAGHTREGGCWGGCGGIALGGLPGAGRNSIIYTVTTFKYVEGGPDREAPEVV